jgi:hypothetical protein
MLPQSAVGEQVQVQTGFPTSLLLAAAAPTDPRRWHPPPAAGCGEHKQQHTHAHTHTRTHAHTHAHLHDAVHGVVHLRLDAAPVARTGTDQQQQRARACCCRCCCLPCCLPCCCWRGVTLPGHQAGGVQQRQVDGRGASLACARTHMGGMVSATWCGRCPSSMTAPAAGGWVWWWWRGGGGGAPAPAPAAGVSRTRTTRPCCCRRRHAMPRRKTPPDSSRRPSCTCTCTCGGMRMTMRLSFPPLSGLKKRRSGLGASACSRSCAMPRC